LPISAASVAINPFLRLGSDTFARGDDDGGDSCVDDDGSDSDANIGDLAEGGVVKMVVEIVVGVLFMVLLSLSVKLLFSPLLMPLLVVVVVVVVVVVGVTDNRDPSSSEFSGVPSSPSVSNACSDM
jgi:hypothetical protein